MFANQQIRPFDADFATDQRLGADRIHASVPDLGRIATWSAVIVRFRVEL